MNFTMRAVCAVGALLMLPTIASAQRWGRDRYPDSGACFFRDADFEGDYFCVRAGDEVARLPDDLNDQISSIMIIGPAQVVVFKDSRFRGGSERFDYSVHNLEDYDWNDRISSMRVEFLPRADFRRRDDDRREDRRGDRDDRRQDQRISGDDPDRIVRRAYQDILGREPDDGGLRQYRSRIIDDGWSEEQVRDSLRNSPEYRVRSTMTREKAQDIVRRAYLNVLKREPDRGAEGYVNNVLRNNWSQEDVERELRNSAEYRNRR